MYKLLSFAVLLANLCLLVKSQSEECKCAMESVQEAIDGIMTEGENLECIDEYNFKEYLTSSGSEDEEEAKLKNLSGLLMELDEAGQVGAIACMVAQASAAVEKAGVNVREACNKDIEAVLQAVANTIEDLKSQ